mmetsp:Transcript_83694/g.270615  ORF Transcript_83694/g.270615 Transcript_83694/m.270615 type:complete len:224 (-) Transcript_83694:50-721(-)
MSSGTHNILPLPITSPSAAVCPAATCLSHRRSKSSGLQNSQRMVAVRGQPARGLPNASSFVIEGGFSTKGSLSPSISTCLAVFSASSIVVSSGSRSPPASNSRGGGGCAVWPAASSAQASSAAVAAAAASAPIDLRFSFLARFLAFPPWRPVSLLQLNSRRCRKRLMGSSRGRRRFSSLPRQKTCTATLGSPSTCRTVASQPLCITSMPAARSARQARSVAAT